MCSTFVIPPNIPPAEQGLGFLPPDRAGIPHSTPLYSSECPSLGHCGRMEPSGSNLVFSLRPFQGVIAVLQLLYTETTPQSGFFLKKKLPSIESVRTYVLENRSRNLLK
jgi:hypothetical protein